MQYLVRSVKARINKRLEAHFHMDFGMGVANTIMALAEGVEVVHSTVLGLGERAGNVPMEETAMALLTLYGIDTGLKYDKFYELCEARAAAFRPRGCRPTGPWSAMRSSRSSPASSPAGWRTAATKMPPNSSRSAGTWSASPRPSVVFGKGSGIDSVKWGLRKLGVQFTEEEAMRVVVAIKEFSLRAQAPADRRGISQRRQRNSPGQAVGSGSAAD